MSEALLVLYTRKGCCLCESLEKRLLGLNLNDFYPFLKLTVKDIDNDDISKEERARYDLEVPVMVLSLKNPSRTIQLSRASPRLDDQGFAKWLLKVLTKINQSNY